MTEKLFYNIFNKKENITTKNIDNFQTELVELFE
jgi:hypothetical protein